MHQLRLHITLIWLPHLSNFAPVVDVAANVAQFLNSLESLCLCYASQSTGVTSNEISHQHSNSCQFHTMDTFRAFRGVSLVQRFSGKLESDFRTTIAIFSIVRIHLI